MIQLDISAAARAALESPVSSHVFAHPVHGARIGVLRSAGIWMAFYWGSTIRGKEVATPEEAVRNLMARHPLRLDIEIEMLDATTRRVFVQTEVPDLRPLAGHIMRLRRGDAWMWVPCMTGPFAHAHIEIPGDTPTGRLAPLVRRKLPPRLVGSTLALKY